MGSSDPTLPSEPTLASEPTVSSAPDGPVSAIPGVPDAMPPTTEATTQMPAQEPTLPLGAAGVPPMYPPSTGYDDPLEYGEEPPVPWYKKPAAIALLILVLLAVGALIAWLIFGGGDDDDDGSPESSRLIIELSDGAGGSVDRTYSTTVVGPAATPTDFVWIQPEDATPGEAALASTGSDGRVDFEWQPSDVVTDPSTWAGTVTVIEGLPAGWTPVGPIVDCVLERPGADESIVTMNAEIASDDGSVDRFVTYTFPNYQFLPGDTVTCTMVSAAPAVEATVVETTVVDTTVPETTVPPTTVPVTTVAPTTTIPIITVPPQPAATLWDVIVANPDLSGIRGWIEQAGLEAEFQDPNATLTLLAPSNQAITDASVLNGGIDFTSTANLLLIVNTHLDETQALLAADIAQLPDVIVVEPGPHTVDGSTDPITIGGAKLLLSDVVASNGVIQVIDKVLIPVALQSP